MLSRMSRMIVDSPSSYRALSRAKAADWWGLAAARFMPPIYMHLANLVSVNPFLFSLYQREVRHRLVYIIQSRKNNRPSNCCTNGQRYTLWPTLRLTSLFHYLRDALGLSNHVVVWLATETQNDVHVLVLSRLTRWREEARARSSMRCNKSWHIPFALNQWEAWWATC